LQENDGDIAASMDWLRAKGLSKAAKKADRAAAEGLVAGKVSADGRTGALIELNAETDFVGRTTRSRPPPGHRRSGLTVEGVDAIAAAKTAKGEVVSDMVTNMIARSARTCACVARLA